jgi:plasmid stabilization system protein ParE
MASSSRAQKAREAAQSAGSNPYIRRLIEDEDLRENLRDAYEALRHAYGRASNGKGPAKAIVEDKKVHKDLRTAAESLREASEQLRGRKRRRPFARLLVIGIFAAGLALILSEDLRKAVLDRMFGAEEEFEYTSTTTPAPEPATTE